MKANKSECESVQSVMARVSHADLLSHYLGIDSLPVLINSPLRNDAHPSFFIYSPDGSKVYYKDYATGDGGDIYSLLMKKKNVSFSKLIREVASERELKKSNHEVYSTVTHAKKFSKINTELKVKVRDWKDYDIAYWESYGVSLRWLKYAEVYPISHKIIYKEGNRYVFPAAKYSYVFVERKEGKVSLKVYSPYNKKYKWMNTNDASVVGLWTKIPKTGDKLAICSSLKDALCLWANIGIPAIYVQSETIGISQTAREEIEKRFRNIYICFDNDEPGLRDGERVAASTGFKNVVLPHFDGGKDISDCYKVLGKERFISMVEPLFK